MKTRPKDRGITNKPNLIRKGSASLEMGIFQAKTHTKCNYTSDTLGLELKSNTPVAAYTSMIANLGTHRTNFKAQI